MCIRDSNDPDDDDDFDTGFYLGAAVDLTPTYPTPGDVYIGIGETLVVPGDDEFDLTIPADINGDITDATMLRAVSFGVRSSLLNPAETPELEIELAVDLSGIGLTNIIYQLPDEGDTITDGSGLVVIEVPSDPTDDLTQIGLSQSDYNYKYYVTDSDNNITQNVRLAMPGGVNIIEEADPSMDVSDTDNGDGISSFQRTEIIIPDRDLVSDDEIYQIHFVQLPQPTIPPGIDAVLPERLIRIQLQIT